MGKSRHYRFSVLSVCSIFVLIFSDPTVVGTGPGFGIDFFFSPSVRCYKQQTTRDEDERFVALEMLGQVGS